MWQRYSSFTIFIASSTIFFVAAAVLFPQKTYAQVVINEFYCATSTDWIEFYNTGDEVVDLSEYYLKDNKSNTKDLDGMIEPGSFAVFEWNSLNQDEDSIFLFHKSDEKFIDDISYGEDVDVLTPQNGQTAGRIPDGSETLELFSEGSKGSSNDNQTIYHTPTPTPTVTPTPTKTPKPTKTPRPTKTPKPTPTSFRLSVNTENPRVRGSSATDSETQRVSSIGAVPTALLGDTDNKKEEEQSEDVKVASEHTNTSGFVFIILSGITFLAICAILLYRKYR